MKRRGFVASALIASLLAGACSPSGPGPTVTPSVPSAPPVASPSAPPIASAGALPTGAATPAATSDRIAGPIDIGGGRHLYLLCDGAGSPTILLEAGDQDTGSNGWAPVRRELVEATRTCTYHRAGLMGSSGATGCRQLDDLLDDLDALLDAADIAGPFVLVGASGGGFIMAGYGARHPDQVAGMVFVETPKALTAELYPEIVPQIACDAPGNFERRDYLAVEHAAWDNRTKIGDFPLVVMSNDYGDSAAPNTDEATNVEDQRGWFDLSPDNARQVVVTTGHGITYAEPGKVIAQILAVLAAARGS